MKKRRKPQHQGCGIYVHQQPFVGLVKGDTFFDADYGPMVWNGKKWVSQLKPAKS